MRSPPTRAAALVLAGLVGCFLTAAAASSPSPTGNLLVSLPSLGTVTWRCTASAGRYQLAFRAFRAGATTDVRLVVSGRTAARARVDPGESRRLSVAGLSQTLELEQFTGAGTVRASVAVTFLRRPVASHCYSYSPPRLRVEVTPRR